MVLFIFHWRGKTNHNQRFNDIDIAQKTDRIAFQMVTRKIYIFICISSFTVNFATYKDNIICGQQHMSIAIAYLTCQSKWKKKKKKKKLYTAATNIRVYVNYL